MQKKGMIGLLAVLMSANLFAETVTNVFNNAGGGAWSELTNWENQLVGGGTGTVTKLSASLTADVTVTLADGVTNTIGSLIVENSGTAGKKWTVTGTGAALDFNNDGSDSVVTVGSGAVLETINVTEQNDVVKMGPGQWNLSPTTSDAFKNHSLIIQEGTNYLGNANYSGANITLKAVDGSSPVLKICNSERKFSGPVITVAAGTGSPVIIYDDAIGKVYHSSLILERMVEFKISNSNGGTFFSGGITGTGGIRKTGPGTMVFGSAPAFSGDIVLSEGTISGGSSYWNTDVEIDVVIGDQFSDTNKFLSWGFSEKGSLPGTKTSFHVTQYGGPVSFYWSKTQSGATCQSPFVLDKTVTFNANINAGSGNTFASVFSGVGGIDFTGNGTNRYFKLTGTNTYEGGTTVASVMVQVGTNSVFGTGDVSVATNGLIRYVVPVNSAIADTATLNLASNETSYAVIDFGAYAVLEKVEHLTINGQKQFGYWGAVGSGADHETPMILGSGRILAGSRGLLMIVR